MKYVIYTIIALASILLIFNLTLLDFDNLFAGDSSIALIGVFAALCTIVLMVILLVSKKIQQKTGK
ncbi:MAG TPA: hypothetical protein VFM65_04385 [Flavobacteriaceae bacterium]|nr:hypothetical protein [Flavobacteriaceae bacterium]